MNEILQNSVIKQIVFNHTADLPKTLLMYIIKAYKYEVIIDFCFLFNHKHIFTKQYYRYELLLYNINIMMPAAHESKNKK